MNDMRIPIRYRRTHLASNDGTRNHHGFSNVYLLLGFYLVSSRNARSTAFLMNYSSTVTIDLGHTLLETSTTIT